MSFNEYLNQLMDTFYTQNLTEGGEIANKIAELLGIKDIEPNEAAKQIVDFIMNSNEADLEKVSKGIETLTKLGVVTEENEINEGGILEFLAKLDNRIKAIILASFVLVPNISAGENFLETLKDKKDQLEQDVDANISTTRQKLEDFVKETMSKAGEAVEDIGDTAKEKAGSFMDKMKREMEKSRESETEEPSEPVKREISPNEV